MHLAFTVSCSNENSIAPGTGCLDLSEEGAKTISKLHDAAMRFREKMSSIGAASEFFRVSVGVGNKLPGFKVVALEVERPSLEDQEGVGLLQADFNLDVLPDSAFCRVECHRVWLETDSVRFSASDKFSGDIFTTAEIPLSVVRAIATGKKPRLPAVKCAVAQ